jgi:hypothetical protein
MAATGLEVSSRGVIDFVGTFHPAHDLVDNAPNDDSQNQARGDARNDKPDNAHGRAVSTECLGEGVPEIS